MGNVTVEKINGVPAEEFVTKDGTFAFDAPVQFMVGIISLPVCLYLFGCIYLL